MSDCVWELVVGGYFFVSNLVLSVTTWMKKAMSIDTLYLAACSPYHPWLHAELLLLSWSPPQWG